MIHRVRPSSAFPRSRRAHRRRHLLVATLLGAGLLSTPARADVASWLYLGGGASALDQARVSDAPAPAMRIDMGMGSDPASALVLGGLFRADTHFGRGTDWAAGVRGATGGYARGSWGAALDVGPWLRPWGAGASGVQLSLALGAPWGVTLAPSWAVGSAETSTWSVHLGIDLARLTVHRTVGEAWWPNPFLPGREQARR